MSKYLLLTLLALPACGSGPAAANPDGGGGGCFGGTTRFGGVCLTLPTQPAKATPCGDVTEFCDRSGAAKLAIECLSGPPKMRPRSPDQVTLTGFVHPFSGGKSNSPVTIQIYRAADLLAGQDPATAPTVVPTQTVTFEPAKAVDAKRFRACDTDAKVGCVAVAPDACKAPTCNDGLGGRQDDGKYCRIKDGAPACEPRLRWEPRFAIPNVPTNTSLVIRAAGMDAKADNQWAVLITWNVFLATDERACTEPQQTDCLDVSDPKSPTYQLNVSVLSQADYFNIPNVSGLSGGLSPGKSAVAGEVRDCNNIRVGAVQVGVSPEGERFTYFNGNPYMTLPDAGRAATGTDRLGLYAALNVAPGQVQVEAAGLVDGKTVSLGKFSAIAYPNSVAVLNLNGGKSAQ